MAKIYKWLLAAISIFVVIALGLFLRRLTSNQLDKALQDSKVVAVRMTLKDQNHTQMLCQIIVFPEQKSTLFYFVNTDAYQPDTSTPIADQVAMFADSFEKYSGIQSSYTIELNRQSVHRLIDLTEGVPMYLESVQTFPGSGFQYPAGRITFSGDQAAEYVLSRKIQPGQDFLSGLDKMRRMESLLLNLFWNNEKIQGKLRSKALQNLALGWFDTNFTATELASLIRFISTTQAYVLEVPLEQTADRRLIVKEKRAKVVFSEFMDGIKSGHTKDQFSLEVLNGTEIGGLARRVKQFLQDRGILVLNADNYPIKPVPRSVILVRSGKTALGRHLMDMTGLPGENVFFDRGAQDVDVTLLLGQDFDIKKLQVFE